MTIRALIPVFLAASASFAQQPAPPSDASGQPGFTVTTGTKVPLTLINSISTKHSAVGDRVYLQTAFPILAGGRIVIPVGSYVAGSITQIKRPGRVKGRGEIYVRFDSLTLPNGVTREFSSRIGSMDGTAAGQVDRTEGKVTADGNKGGDLMTVGQAAGTGATIGAIGGSAADRPGLGIGIGAGAGAAAGLIGVLASRGPDAVLARGTTLEMVLDRNLTYNEDELAGNPQAPRAMMPQPQDPQGSQMRRRFM